MDFASCKDMTPKRGGVDIFFPSAGQSGLIKKAIEVCESCPVRPECEEWRRRCGSNFGVWNGTFHDGGRTRKET